MTAPQGPGIDRASVRGIIVLVVAVVIGVALLSQVGGDPLETSATGNDPAEETTTETTAAGDESTVPPDTLVPTSEPGGADGTRPPGEVTVLVVNAADGVPGAAGDNKAVADQAGYETLPPENAPTAGTTTVFFTGDHEAEAAAVGDALGFPDAPVAPMLEPIIPEAAEADVIVQLGQDIASG